MVNMIAKEDVNTGRQFEFDVAKFFALFFMVIVHVSSNLSVWSGAIVLQSFFHFFIVFGGSALSAPVFMFAMGVGMVYTKHNSPKDFAYRGVKLLLSGYALNFFRETLLIIIANGLKLQVNLPRDLISSIGFVDILQLAGMSFLLMALIKKASLNIRMTLCVAFLLQALGTLFIGFFQSAPIPLQYIVGLLFYTNDYTSFSATAWFVYPALGVCFAYLLRRVNDKHRFYRSVLWISATLLLSVTICSYAMGIEITSYFVLPAYYQQGFLSSLLNLSVVGIALSLYYYLSCLIKGRLKNVIKYISANINVIYIAQWLLIAYSYLGKELFELPDLAPGWVIPTGVLFSIICILIMYGWNHIKSIFRIQATK
ncbi:MAG: heparan-alpha-glucosaminide N-acetyltransferase domain-containing protein [Oscillospiraceae bacterium]